MMMDTISVEIDNDTHQQVVEMIGEQNLNDFFVESLKAYVDFLKNLTKPPPINLCEALHPDFLPIFYQVLQKYQAKHTANLI